MSDQPADVFDPTLKKKKKKKAVVADETAAPEPILEPAVEEAPAAEGGDLTEVFGKKKKKSKSKKVGFEAEDEIDDTPAEIAKSDVGADDVVFAEPMTGAVQQTSTSMPWLGSDRDYKYDELLDRILGIISEFHPELSGEKRRHVMRPPQIGREGTKKTVFANFAEICRTMHRQLDHVFQFLLAELGTQGSLDGSGRLILKGRFQQKGIENVLRRYITEYVTCHSCKSPDTKLEKENRLYFLRCKSCGASRTVVAIKSGFQAQVGKRAAQRAATA